MKRLMRWFHVVVLVLALMSLLAWPVFAQNAQQGSGTAVTQTATTGLAATACSSANGSGQQTLTIANPGPNLSNYLTYIAIWGLASGIPTQATPTVATMTGVAGTSPALAPLATNYPAAGAQGSVSGGPIPLIGPIKGLTGTAVAIIGPTAITNMNQAIEACFYVAP